MKKLTLLLWTLSLLIFNSCGGIKGLMVYDVDDRLPTLGTVHSLAKHNSVGFEWSKINDHHVDGINIYRKSNNGESEHYKHIGSIDNPYATHFVDMMVKPNHNYAYSFRTFSLGKESKASSIVEVRTLPTFAPVSFVEAYKVAPNVAKILWKPHPNPSINSYILERTSNGKNWEFISTIHGNLMVEYIDTYAKDKHAYAYRVIAQSFDKIQAQPSPIAQITM